MQQVVCVGLWCVRRGVTDDRALVLQKYSGGSVFKYV